MHRIRGTGLAPGCVMGPLALLPVRDIRTGSRRETADGVEEELSRLRRGIAAAIGRNDALLTRLREESRGDEYALFRGFGAIMADPELAGEIEERIRAGGVPAETAVREVGEAYCADVAGLADRYLSERAEDLRSLFRGIEDAVAGAGTAPGAPVASAATDTPAASGRPADGPAILVCPELTAGILAGIDPADLGIPPGHGDGRRAILDGDSGTLTLDPDAGEADAFRVRTAGTAARASAHASATVAGTATADGHRVSLLANASSVDEAREAFARGADGIGLFRTEVLFLDRTELPTEDEQARLYGRVVTAMGGREVVFRTIDVGADKPVPALGLQKEDNPALGYRAIRYCLDHPELLLSQLRAILRAGEQGPVGIMFPMVISPDEVTALRGLVERADRDLHGRGPRPGMAPRIGIMIETPAAALIADELASLVDFFSIGTNDLTQYTLAVDRCNERVSRLYREDHPAVLRLIARTIQAGRRRGIPVAVCGEMAGDPRYTELLLGVGLEELSMSVPRLQTIADRVRTIKWERAGKSREPDGDGSAMP